MATLKNILILLNDLDSTKFSLNSKFTQKSRKITVILHKGLASNYLQKQSTAAPRELTPNKVGYSIKRY